MAGAPIGNNNPEKGKRWKLAIDAALAKRGKDKVDALAEIAEQLLAKASEGDISALKELGDRIDGKAAQAINLGDHEGKALTINVVNGLARNQPTK
jgi:hypothetical protein